MQPSCHGRPASERSLRRRTLRLLLAPNVLCAGAREQGPHSWPVSAIAGDAKQHGALLDAALIQRRVAARDQPSAEVAGDEPDERADPDPEREDEQVRAHKFSARREKREAAGERGPDAGFGKTATSLSTCWAMPERGAGRMPLARAPRSGGAAGAAGPSRTLAPAEQGEKQSLVGVETVASSRSRESRREERSVGEGFDDGGMHVRRTAHHGSVAEHGGDALDRGLHLALRLARAPRWTELTQRAGSDRRRVPGAEVLRAEVVAHGVAEVSVHVRGANRLGGTVAVHVLEQ